jgi:glycosyltransferase involved in cell wall biosynthesis
VSKILWISNAPWGGSGYGEQTAMFARRFRALGHEVTLAANWGLEGTTFEWDGFTVFPTDRDHGNRAIEEWALASGAELVVFLCDSWVVKPESWPKTLDPDLPVAIWAPIDHRPMPPAVFKALDHVRISPIAMSRFGTREMRRVALEHLYVPHGVDTSVFSPRLETRDAIRDELDIPRDAFLVGMVAANQGSPQLPRKAFPEAFQAFARFAAAHDDAFLYVHANAIPSGTGINLERCALMAGIPTARLRFPNRALQALGFGAEVVSHLYQAFSVLLQPSYGEGFGIPILEAQASGVPVIVSNATAMPELLGAGWLVQGQGLWDALSDAWFFMPFVHSIREALEGAYAARGDRELRARAVAFAADYDASRVALERWVPALEALGCSSELPVEEVAAA